MLVLREQGAFFDDCDDVMFASLAIMIFALTNFLPIVSQICSDLVEDLKSSLDRVMEEEREGEQKVAVA